MLVYQRLWSAAFWSQASHKSHEEKGSCESREYQAGERVWSPQCFCWLESAQCVYSWTRTLLGGLWNVHNFCDTCTTSVKRAQLLGTRAQLLGNVHNISEPCITSLTRAQHLWNVHNISEMCTYRILENTGYGRWNTLCPYQDIAG